jgi:hypothetical protein
MERLNPIRMDTYNELVNLAITQEDYILAHRAEKKRKAPVGPSSAQPPSYRLVQNAAPKALQNAPRPGRWIIRPPKQQGVAWQDPLLHSQMVQDRIYSSHPARVTPTDVSIVGVLLTLFEIAPGPDSKLRAKAPTPTTETRARSRLFRSSVGGSISPPLQSFPMAH